MAKRITAYKCSDGTVFENFNDANKHDAVLHFRDWYEDHKLLGNCDDCKVDLEDLVDWLNKHKTTVIYFYGLDTQTEQSA